MVKDSPAYGVVNLEQLPEGHLIDDRYEVKGKLGQGGFEAVYRVFDRKMECDKALKVLPESVASDLEAMESIRSEAVTMARLNHSNIVRIFEFQDKGTITYIEMEYVDGMSLTELKLKAPDKKLREEDAVSFAAGLAQGLAHLAHHGDVENVHGRAVEYQLGPAIGNRQLYGAHPGNDTSAAHRIRPTEQRPLLKRPAVSRGIRYALGLNTSHPRGPQHGSAQGTD